MSGPQQQSLLTNKRNLVIAVLVCASELVLSVRSLGDYPVLWHDWLHLSGLLFAIAIFFGLAVKAKDLRERLVFGLGAIALSLSVVLSIVMPQIETVRVTRWMITLAWAGATIDALTLLRGREES
jgi:hypothetical protein